MVSCGCFEYEFCIVFIREFLFPDKERVVEVFFFLVVYGYTCHLTWTSLPCSKFKWDFNQKNQGWKAGPSTSDFDIDQTRHSCFWWTTSPLLNNITFLALSGCCLLLAHYILGKVLGNDSKVALEIQSSSICMGAFCGCWSLTACTDPRSLISRLAELSCFALADVSVVSTTEPFFLPGMQCAFERDVHKEQARMYCLLWWCATQWSDLHKGGSESPWGMW